MRYLNRTKFMELMERFCPEYKFVRGPFGGENWSKDGSYWNSYMRAGVANDLISAMDRRILELEKGK